MEETFIVSDEFSGVRLDKFLSMKLNFVSRSKIHNSIINGNVLVDREVKKPSYRLKTNQKIIVKLIEKKHLLEPFDFKINIIYEDEDILIIDKPTNIIVHPITENSNRTIVNALVYMKKELSTVNLNRCGVVHRLDKETSGVMVFAKNNYSHLNLVEQFRLRKVKKEYLAICWGILDKESIKIDLPLARDSKNRLKMKISFIKSKSAYTEIFVLEKLKDSTLLSIKPITGRMHQIRVHLKFLEHPIVGDKKYNIKDKEKELFLHAHKLGFFHPRKNNFVEFVSPMPERFKNFILIHR